MLPEGKPKWKHCLEIHPVLRVQRTNLYTNHNDTEQLVEADLHHHQAPATHPMEEVAMEEVEAMEVDPQEADLRVVALQDQVEAVDHQVMNHQEILQLQVHP